MFDVGGGELLLIVFAILILFGPEKLPELAQMFGKGMQKVRQAQAIFQSQLNEIQTEVSKSVDMKGFDLKNFNLKNFDINKIIEQPQPADNIVPNTPHKIGALDQLGTEEGFVTDYLPPVYQNEDNRKMPEENENIKIGPENKENIESNIEKETTKKKLE